MRWLLRVLIVLVAAVAVVAIVGWRLPVGHVVSRSVIVPAAPDVVYARISDVPSYPQWWSEVTRVETLPPVDGRPRYREHMSMGPVVFEIVEATPPGWFVSRIADPDQPFGGTWAFELSAEGAGTRVRLTERGEVYNPVFRFLSRFVFSQSATVESFLAALTRSVTAQ
ncbi:MAG TPA: SRPBCC family protein [Vicinamibacterales bacterium]